MADTPRHFSIKSRKPDSVIKFEESRYITSVYMSRTRIDASWAARTLDISNDQPQEKVAYNITLGFRFNDTGGPRVVLSAAGKAGIELRNTKELGDRHKTLECEIDADDVSHLLNAIVQNKNLSNSERAAILAELEKVRVSPEERAEIIHGLL